VQKKTLRFGRGFRVALGNARSQAAVMVIPPGDAEGDPHNRHRGADQWLFVLEGRGLLRTLNVYVPPAYDKQGDELPRGKP
jgi:mannose-6-phosphate isomerase-like protein (cupin superfamily)